jgi:hypothetical protein
MKKSLKMMLLLALAIGSFSIYSEAQQSQVRVLTLSTLM